MARRQTYRRAAGAGAIASLVLAASFSARFVAAAPEAAATQPDEKVWELTDYLKGTAPQIRDLVNGELERLLAIRKGREQLLAKSNADLAAVQAKLLDALHKTPNFQRLVVDTKTAQADLEALRRDPASPAQKKMDASSKYNQLRAAMDKLEKETLAADKESARLRREVTDYQADLKRNDKSVETARKWRDQLIPAIRTTYRLRWPVRAGSHGIFGEVTPIAVIDSQTVVIDYEAPEFLQAKRQGEGIATFGVEMHKLHVRLIGIDTKGMTKGTPIVIDKNFEIEHVDYARSDETLACEAERKHDDVDRLMELLVPLRDLGPPNQ